MTVEPDIGQPVFWMHIGCVLRNPVSICLWKIVGFTGMTNGRLSTEMN